MEDNELTMIKSVDAVLDATWAKYADGEEEDLWGKSGKDH